MPPSFPRETLAFLRALKRNNHREWFRERKAQYDLVVRAPMIAVIVATFAAIVPLVRFLNEPLSSTPADR